MKKVAFFFAIALVGLTGCSEIGDDMSTNTLIPVSTNAGAEPTIGEIPSGPAPTELVAQDVIVGTGATVAATSMLTVHYTLLQWSDGSLIESSWSSGNPATFGLMDVIPGWQQGLVGAKAGSRRLLVIPPALGYGPMAGHPLETQTLIFAVDIISIS
jgi:peptidylprolyl isomerase